MSTRGSAAPTSTPPERSNGDHAWLASDADSNPVGLLADTADSNTHMRHISESLGYLPTHTTLQYQLDL
ncbi:hypothetical protein GCM10010299_22040 [Streptomyces tanashiensis]|nr:hypothetical protein GCM10010299_22040 [Streptomyces tanashiensis]